MNSRRECEKYNQYGIKKFNAGAASVLIASGFFFLGGAAQAADLASKQETNVENVTGNDKASPDSNKKSEEVSATVANTRPTTTAKEEAPKTEVKIEKAVVNKAKLQEKIDKLNDLFVTLAGRDLSETQQKLTVDAAIELNKAKDLIVSETATQGQVDAQTVAVENSISFLNKSLEATKAEEKKADDKKSDKEVAKENLEKTVSEAKVVNQAANTLAAKSATEEAKKEIKAAVEAAEKQIAKVLDLFKSDSTTKQDSERERKELENAIEAVYATMKRAGHTGKLEGLLADVSSTVKTPERTRIRNLGELTDEEVAEIIRQVRIANPNLTAQDRVEVVKKAGAFEAGKVTITYANGDTATISSAETVLGAGVARNVEALKDAINWFEFSSATIVYPDGTEAGPARYMNTEKKIMVDDPIGDGTKVQGNLRIVRDIKYADGTTGLSTDDKFLNSGIAEFTMHRNYLNQYINNREVYEVLKEGMVLKVPTRVKGYNLTLRVEKLAPKPVATDPNTTATRGKNAMRSSEGSTEQFKPVKMILQTRDGYSYLNSAGVAINDPSGRPALSSISANRDGANVGITFSASATYNGQPVPVNLVAVDGEEATRGEFYQVETNGSNWKELMSLNLNERQVTSQNGYPLGQDYSAITAGNLDFYGNYKRDGYNSNEWVNKIQDTDSSGNLRYDKSGNPIMKETVFGTKYFGPAWTAKAQGHALPIGFSEGVSEFSMYINSNGSQAGTIGFVVFDGGDAPQSYGSAQHVIGNINKVNSSGQQVVATQPHFGTEPGDPDFRSTSTDPAGAWTLDDLIHTNGYKVINMHEGKAVTNEAGDTGTYKLLDVNGRKTPVLLKADGSTVALKTGEILKINNPEDNFPVQGIFDVASQGVGVGTLPDEGKGQLLDPAVASDYKLRQATDNEYVLDGIKVNSGENNDVAYARGWVDFNNNGKFDDGESSEVIEVRGKQTVSFKFKRTPQLLNTSIDSVGIRLRIALDKKEILSPTGLASSGEVEDFQTHVIHPPRGTENSTQDLQGKPQKLDINTTDLLTATGKTEASKYATWNQMDNTVAPKFVVTESVVASETATGNTVNIVDATGNTVYNGTEVTIRDARGNTLGTAVKVTNPLNGTTEYLLSEYTEYDTAGNLVGTYSLNKDNNGLNKAGTNGIYRTTIDFKPALAYVGTAKGVAIRAWDQNRISTGWNASDKTIEESKKNITLADRDKILKNTNENVNGRYSMDSTYIPTVIDVRPVGEDTVTEDVQGKPQFATPKIPAYGTVETVTGDKITDVKYTSDYVILDKNVKPRFAQTFENRKSKYDKDTPVSTTTTLTLEDGRVVTYKPDTEKIPARTKIAETSSIEVSGTGVVVDNVRVTSGTLPAGASPQADHPVTTPTEVILSDGTESTIPAGGKIPRGAKLKNAYVSKVTNTWDNVTYNTGDTIPQASYGKVPVLKEATAASQIVSTGNVVRIDNQYIANGIIPAGKKAKKVLPFNEVVLPKAVHLDPTTGVISEVPRSYDLANTNDTKVTIIGEGVYELNQTTGEIKFTPEPGFVGTGTGVDLEQPDIDYNNKVAGDSVTSKYGTDYGRARYTPIVTPKTSASITRTIHYVYEDDTDNPSSSDSYKNNKEILAIDGEPVVTKQTLNYTRTYKIFEEEGVLETATRSAIPVTDVTGRTYAVGEEIPAGTKFAQGKIIISEWKAEDQNSVMRQVISPTVKGYTANVVTADFTAANAQGKMGHIHNNKQSVGLYTPVTDNTRDVGEYEPLVSEVTADNTDDFDMYVVYKRDTQKANVVYIDLDEKGDKRVLETQSGLTEADLTAANKQKDAKTEYNVADLRGKSDTKIPYDTAATIKKYTDKGYELASDDYKNDENGNVLANGRNFDEDSTNDQTFYVYLRHKKEQLSTNDKRTVTRHIEYKYADTTDVPADKRGQHVEESLAKTVTEILTFERTRTLDMATTAKLFENEYNAYKAVLANNAVGSDAEVDARATLFEFVQGEVNKPTATDEVKAIISYGEWQAKPGTGENITLSAAEKTIKDTKFNDVVSPTVPGYLPDNAKVEATADVNPESDPDDYTVTVTYSPGDQKAIVNFVEVDATNTDQVITPGLADPVTITGKSGAAFPTTASTSVQAKIDELVKKGYELVPNGNGFIATDSFDTNAEVDQTYTVKLRAKEAPVVPTDNVTPVPGQPVDPNNSNGPKWPESVKNLVNKDTVKRTIKYVYEDGTPVIVPATGTQKVVEQTAEFTRTANVNLVTGDITYGDWTPAEGTNLVAVPSPTSTDIPAVAKYVPSTATVPVVKVKAGQDDIIETVVYRKANPVTVQPNDPTPTKDTPIDPNNTDPNAPKWTEELLKKLEDTRKEEVTRTITYKYSDVATDLKAEDAAKAGTDVKDNVTVTNTVTFKRPVTIDPQTGEFTYGDWVATNNDTTLEGNTTVPVVPGYVATGDVEKSKTDVTDVKATDKDITEKVVYKALGKYVPVVPEGFTPPTIENPQYPNNNEDPSKPGDPTTTTTIPYVPGTTPVGPDGQPLTPKNGDKTQGYLPPTPTTPTGDTTITYVKDGTQIAVTKFVDTTGKGLEPSVVDTGDTGKAFTKDADVTAAINKILARGYEKVANVNAGEKDYPSTDAEKVFDADAKTNQEFTVTFKPKELPTDPTKPVDPNNNPVDPTDPASPNKPRDPETTVTPKPTDPVPNDPKGRTYGELGLVEQVTRTIDYVYDNGTKVEEDKLGTAKDERTKTLTFTRNAKINAVTGEVTYLDANGNATTKELAPWTPATTDTFNTVNSPVIDTYVLLDSNQKTITGETVAATDKDIAHKVVYKKAGSIKPQIPAGVTPLTPATDTPYLNNPQDSSGVLKPDPTKPTDPTQPNGPTTPVIPEVTGYTPYGPNGKPLEKDPNGGYKVPDLPTDPTQDTPIVYVKNGEQLAITKFVDVNGNGLAPSVVDSGDEGTNFTKDGDVTATINAILARGYEKVANVNATEKEYPTEATDKVFDKDASTNQEFTVTFKPKDLPVDPTKPVDPNNNPVDPTNPTPTNPTTPRDPNTSVTPKPEDKVPNDPKGRTYGELGLVEQVTRTINYVKNDGSKAAEPVKETLTFTRKAKINAVTGEVTYLDNDGNATTKEAAPWTPVNGDKFTEKVSPAVPNYTPTVEKVAEKTGVTATDEDIVETVVYNPTKQTVDPNAPKDPSTPNVTPKPNDVVPNDPKGRTYKELGLIEEVTRTVHYVYEDGTKAADDKVQTITFTRTAEIDTVTGAISNFGTWTLKDENNTFEPETTEAKAGYVASAAKSTEVTGVQATDKDTEETIIYRKLGSYVPVVPAGVTPPANFDKTPKPYPNATPEDPTRPGTPTTPTTTIPEIPGTTPVGPDGTPLTKNPNGGYDLPPVPTDPTQNTTITYVKDGSQVAVVHFVDEKGRAVNESVVETGDTGNTISKTNVDAIKTKLEGKGYVVVEPTDALYTTDKEGFYKEETRTFDAVSDKSTGTAGEKVPSQQYYVIVKAKEIPADPTKPGTTPGTDTPTNPTPENPTPENPTPGTNTPAKPGDKIPGDPLNRTYGDLGLVEEVTRTINYVKNDGSKAADPVKETLTFTRKAKINAVTGEVTYLAADGVTPVASKDDAPWTAANGTEFKAVKSPTGAEKPELANYTPTKAEVEAKTGVTATDEDIVETVVYNPTTETVNPKDPNFDPEKPLDPNNPNGPKYKDLKLTEEVARTITYTYANDVADTTKRGTVAAPEFKTTVSFTRTATINKATGEVTYSDWTAKDNDTTLEKDTKDVPLITGYVATGDLDKIKEDVTNVNATDKDITDNIVYKDLGKYVPVVPEGTTPPTIENPKYPNHPTDPTKPGEPTTTIPNVPGLTPLDPSTGKPLEPKDPNDLTKGYKPPVPQDPSKDTNIVYVADGSQVTVVHFVDEDGKAVHTSFVEAGDAGAKFTKAGEVTKVVDELKKQGYVVVPNKAGQAEYPGEAGVFDSVDDKGKDGVSQVYYVTVAKTIPVTPTTPQNPNEEPKNPNPGDPIDPNNPTGPKWTKDALDKLNNIKSVTRTITYVKDGTDEEVSTTEAPKVTNKVSFTRTVVVNPKDGSVVGYDTNGDGVADVPATDTTSGWKAAGTAKFAEVKSPVVKGYVVKPNQDTQGDLVEADGSKVKASTTDLTVDSANQDLKVRYVPVGTWTPKVPEGETPIDPIPYPNDPTDPGKVVDPNKPTDPNDPNKPSVPVVPYIPGTTPKDPNGNPLKPVDPEDPTKGYVPPTPTTPTENTVIEYVKDDQKAVTKFVDPSGNPIPGVNNIEEKGKSGEPLTKATEVTTEIAKLIAKGYDLVSNNYGKDNNGNFDKDSGKDQEYTVVLTPHVEPIKPFDPTNPNDPNTPKPGQPIDPNNPDGPKWTKELIDKLETTKHVNRTITYVEDGTEKEVADKATDKVTFTREAKINVVTGTIEYGKWTPVNNDTKFDKVTSPVVKGYVLKDATQKEVAETTGLTENSKDENIKVAYVKVGSIVPKIPDGETPSTPATPTPYDNVPNEPGKVVTPDPTKPTDPQDPNSPKVPVIPHVPGYTPKVPQDPTKPVDPKTNPLVPLTPVDPQDPTKGYEVPPVPTDPTKNIEIEYVKDEQKAVTKFVDPSGNPIPGVNNIEEKGKSGEPLTKATEVTTEIAKLIAKGYDLVSNNYGKDNNGNFDKDSGKDQEYTVVLTPHVEPIKPFDPTNPNDPNTPKPGQPIDPNNPDGPKWTKELIDKLETTKHVNRTISYVDKDGNKVEYTDKGGNKSTADVTDKVTFTREAKINVVTGDITYGKWIPVNNDTTFDKVTSPVVPGYVLKDPAQKEVAETTGLTENSEDENIKVVYVKVGSIVPKVPEGVTPPTPTPYDNDPQDPGKVVPPSPTKPTDPTDPNSPKVPVIPHIPGTTPQVPKDPTKPVGPNNPLVPLKPVDPKDPSKGYEVPPVPTNPNTDTPIYYVNDKQKAITNFVDNNGKVVSTPVVDQGDSGSKFTKGGEVESKIKELVKKGYVVTSNEYPSDDKDRVFDKDKDKDQIFNVTLTPLIVPTDPNSPDKPQVPTDPTKPVGPNNPLKPATPSTPEPGKPVFPEDPNSPVWPDTVKDLVTESSATRTITYVDQNGKEVAATHTETIKFKRSAKVNLVTGEITYGEWTVVGDDTILDGNKLPKVDGYIARGGDIKESQEDIKATVGTNITQTVVYDKLGSWVPKVPEGVTPVPPITYPNDPTDPTKPGKDKPIVPHVPGFIPVGPDGTPLKPVDPTDPSKGYEVPGVPADPTKDTPISYVPVNPETPVTPAAPKAPKAGRLANTGTTETNTGLVGLGMAIFGGLLAVAKRRKEKK